MLDPPVKKNRQLLQKMASHFQTAGSFVESHPFGSGHIHDTYLITTGPVPQKQYLLQRMNPLVFRNIPGLMSNIERITLHIRQKLAMLPGHDPNRECLTLISTSDGRTFLEDDEGNCWRMYLFIPNSFSYDTADEAPKVLEGGTAFGRFMNSLSDLPGERLCDTIPNFHDMENRLQHFYNSVQKDPAGRVGAVLPEIRWIEKRADRMLTVQRLGQKGHITERITHNDTKFNNVLFDSQNKAFCVVDLDTVMPGYVHYDFGDAVRTCASTGAEDEADLSRITLDLEFYKAFARGFLKETMSILSPIEIETLAFSPEMMTFIQGLRFLTDYIEGDIYFKIHFPEQNLQRTRAQFRLAEFMEMKKNQMEDVIFEIEDENRRSWDK